MAINRWWDSDPAEHFWLEVTDRADLGADLNAPAADERGGEPFSYALVREADDGDVVFHFHKPSEAIVAHSTIRGTAWQDEVVWGAKGTSARDRDITPYARPGYRRALVGFTRLAVPVTLQEVRDHEPAVMALRDELTTRHGGSLYFPFVPYKGQPLRTFQGYLLKMPRELVQLLRLPLVRSEPEASGVSGRRPTATTPVTTIGAPYRLADEHVAVSTVDPMPRDPALVERALRSHRRTQNQLAAFLQSRGIEPLAPAPADPDWDIAWRRDGRFFVGEVKSLTASNEERQLRLGLGQVLRYRHALSVSGEKSVAVLVAEREPQDPGWCRLADELDVRLVWPLSWSSLVT